ncbi:hypothetical protein [Amycolatopsis sp. NPDC004378]
MNDPAAGSATPIFDTLIAEIRVPWPHPATGALDAEPAASLPDSPEPQAATGC